MTLLVLRMIQESHKQKHELFPHFAWRDATRRNGLIRINVPPLSLENLDLPKHVDSDLVALDEALEDLASFAPRQAEAVKLSFFGGLNLEEIATALEVSVITVRRDLTAAKIWLLDALRKDRSDAEGGD